MRTAVGGTFNVLHRGHRALLNTAFSRGGGVVIGISSDRFAADRKEKLVPLQERKARLERYLSSRHDDWSILVLEDPMGPAVTRGDIDTLVVTAGNKDVGERINAERRARGLQPLELVLVPYSLADDYLPISSSRIMSGEIDEEGRLLRPLKVIVGSRNPVKVGAVGAVMDRLMIDHLVLSVDPGPTVEQPFHDDTLLGARSRALFALDHGDLGVGIEAGVFEREDGLYDVQYCVIIDKGGWETLGHGSGFRYPPGVSRLVRSGMTVSQAFESLYGVSEIGRREGAIGFLTQGALTRTQLTEQAVMAAMVPRIRRDIYRGI